MMSSLNNKIDNKGVVNKRDLADKSEIEEDIDVKFNDNVIRYANEHYDTNNVVGDIVDGNSVSDRNDIVVDPVVVSSVDSEVVVGEGMVDNEIVDGDEFCDVVKKSKKRSFFDANDKNICDKSFICSICSDYLVSPVCLTCGHNFCKDCITKWIETNRADFAHPSCPVCRAKVCVEHDSLAVNKLLEFCIINYMISLEENEDTQLFKKRQKKSLKSEQLKTFAKNFKKSKHFKSIRSRIDLVLRESNGIIKYNDLVEKLKQHNIEKVELDLFFASKLKKPIGLLLIGDYVIDCWNYNNMGDDSDIVKYLYKNPNELMYAYINDGLTESFILDKFQTPQSEFFKTIMDEKKVMKALYILKKKQ